MLDSSGALQEQLTPQGMRQRYLLGKYNFHLWGDDFFKLDSLDQSSLSEVHMLSTDVYRTI